MRGRTWLVGGVAIGIACSPSGGREHERIGQTREPIYGGQVDDADRFAVGVCHGRAGACDGTCSGALILPNVVATARHCVEQAPESVDCLTPEGGAVTFGPRQVGTFFVTTNTALDSDGSGPGWYSVQTILVSPDSTFCGNDIALLVLASLVPATDAKPITPGVQYLMSDPEYAQLFTGIGYGQTEPAGVPGGQSGTRHRLDGIKVICIPDSPNLPCAQHNPAEFAGGDGLCTGDSGSNAFEKTSIEKGAPVSFGVLSRAGDCAASTYTRFDAHRDFVLTTAKMASNNFTLYPEPPWTAPRPVPADAGLEAGNAAPAALGQACATPEDCASGVCADVGGGAKACSETCVAADPHACPTGFTCKAGLCERGSSPAAASSGGGGCGCSVPGTRGGPGRTAGLGAFAALVAAVAGRLRRRRVPAHPSRRLGS